MSRRGRSSSTRINGGRLPYDYLILAAGANHAYFGHDEWAPNAPGLKTLEDALDIRRRILMSFEEAEREPDPARRKALMTFVVVGGGPTGVEMAGAIAEIARFSLARDFRHIDTRDARVILIEASTQLLAAFPDRLSRHALGDLERLGVDVRFGKPVTAIAPDAVTVGDETIPANTIVWAAGVQASPLGRSLGVELDRAGRVLVNPDLSVPGHPEIFVIGDMASLKDARGRPLPGVAQVAMQQGAWAAANILRAIEGKPATPVPLPRPRQHGDHRPQFGGGRHSRSAPDRLCGLACLGGRAHPQSDWVPQSGAGRIAVALVVPHLAARGAADHGSGAMKLYLAGPMFTAAEEAHNLRLAAKLRDHGFAVFCPNESEPSSDKTRTDITPRLIYDVDIEAVESCNVLICQVSEDSGTNWEAGYMNCLSRRVDPGRYYGVIGLATDIRLRTPPHPERHGVENQTLHINALVIGGLQRSLGVYLDEDSMIERLQEIRREREGGR